MVRMLISRSVRIFTGHGGRMLHVEGMSAIQFDALPSELRGKWSQEYYGSEIRYYMEFESEEAAALFKLEYM